MRRCYKVTLKLSLVQAEGGRLSQAALSRSAPAPIGRPALRPEPPAPHQAGNSEEIRGSVTRELLGGTRHYDFSTSRCLSRPRRARRSPQGPSGGAGPASPPGGPRRQRPGSAVAPSRPQAPHPPPAPAGRGGAGLEQSADPDWKVVFRATTRPGVPNALWIVDALGWAHVWAAGVRAGARARLRAGLAPAAAGAGSLAIASSIIPSSPVPFTLYTSDCLGLNITRGNNTNSLSQRRNQLLRHLLWKGL